MPVTLPAARARPLAKKLRLQGLRKERTMVELPPKMMGEERPQMFHRFMAVP